MNWKFARRVVPAIALMVAGITTSGCSKPPAPQTPTPVAVPAGPVIPPQAAPKAEDAMAQAGNLAGGQANAGKAGGTTKGTKSGTSSSSNAADRGELPTDIFTLDREQPAFNLSEDPVPPLPKDQFTLVSADTGRNSSNFVLTETGTQTTTTPSAEAMKLPAGFVPLKGTTYDPSGWPRSIICEKDGSQMAFIPPGPGTLGTDNGPKFAQPQVTILLDPYYIDVFETTVGQYNTFREEQKPAERANLVAAVNQNSDRMLPALGINAASAIAYAHWTGRELPTEAEFEKAGRGPEGFIYPWGNSRPLWSTPRTITTITPGGTYAADYSPFGVFDLAGNAREWVLDPFSDEGHKEAAEHRNGNKNWAGATRHRIANTRTIKGVGGTPPLGAGTEWTLWARQPGNYQDKDPLVGFRCVLKLDKPAKDGGKTKDGKDKENAPRPPGRNQGPRPPAPKPAESGF